MVLEGSALKQVFQGNFSEGLEIFENIRFYFEEIKEELLADYVHVLEEN